MRIFLQLGCAGVGKSTLTFNFVNWLRNKGNEKVYTMNLDPAVKHLLYTPDFDIRKNVDYHGIQKNYDIGPNGAIVLSLNFLMGKIDQIIAIMKKRSSEGNVIFIDTPGQTELFTKSAFGEVFIKSLKKVFDSDFEILYVVEKDHMNKKESTTVNMLHAATLSSRYKVCVWCVYTKYDKEDVKFANVEYLSLAMDEMSEDDEYHSNLYTDIQNVFSDCFNRLPVLKFGWGDGLEKSGKRKMPNVEINEESFKKLGLV